MSKLLDRYPHVPRLSLPESASANPDDLLQLIAPYLSWILVDLDTFPTDILLREPQGANNPPGLVIITGPAVDIWLQHQQNASL